MKIEEWTGDSGDTVGADDSAHSAVRAAPVRVSLEQAAFIALQRLASDLTQGITEVLKAAGLSGPQYNVLRILRGAGPEGLSCSEIAARLITRDPDITRLLDRLETRDLVARFRESEDRRVVTTRITAAGQELLASLDEPVDAVHQRQLGHLGQDRLGTLLELLRAVSPER